MYYIIVLSLINFSRFLDEAGSIRLATVSGRLASFKHQHNSCFPRQLPPLFQIDCLFSWPSIDLFLGFFTGAGRSLIWGVDNVVEVIQICSYFMVSEHFLSEVFRCTFPPNYCLSFRENQFLEVLFALKLSGYLCLARDLLFCASNEYEEIFVFEDLMLAPNIACLRCLIDDRLRNLEQDLSSRSNFLFNFVIVVFVNFLG